jgi:glycosyltransferase involved in cell wall biosynthesis
VRIAYSFDRPLPATETDSEQAVKTIAALARRGHQLHLIIPAAPMPADLRDLTRYYQVQGVFEVVSLPNPLRGWPTGRKWWHAWRIGLLPAIRDADVLYTRNFPTLLLAARAQKPFVYETYRNWMDQFPVLRSPFRRVMTHPLFLGAVLHSDFARGRYRALGVEAERLEVVHNGYDPDQFKRRLERREARASLGLDLDRPLVTYTGHVNVTKGLDVVVAMARRLPEVDFCLVGASGSGFIETWANQLPNIRVVPWQPFDKVIEYLFASDILIQPPSSIPLKWVGNTVLPMKLFLYLAAGRPILAPDLPDLREILVDRVNALLVAPGDVVSAVAAVKELLSDSELAGRLARAALHSAAGLTWDARAEKIERFILRRMKAMAGPVRDHAFSAVGKNGAR